MAFTIEDGTGQSQANAYITEQEYRDHHADRGVDVTGDAQVDVEAAIVKATDYVDKRFGLRFRGWRRSNGQALQWPRLDAYDNADFALIGVPVLLKRAIAEYAWLSLRLARELAPLPGMGFPIVDPETGVLTQQAGGAIAALKEKVDVIETMVQFTQDNQPMVTSGNTLVARLPEYPQADLWLEELISDDRMVQRG